MFYLGAVLLEVSLRLRGEVHAANDSSLAILRLASFRDLLVRARHAD
jgi:hypothetical protein